MALASASAVIPAPVAENANGAAPAPMRGGGAKFSETLESVLLNSAAQTKGLSGKTDPTAIDAAGAAKILKLKSKAKTPDADAAAVMQAAIQKVADTSANLRGINMNALRTSLARQQIEPSGTQAAGTSNADAGANPQTAFADAQVPAAGSPSADTHILPTVDPVSGRIDEPAKAAGTKQAAEQPASSGMPTPETQAKLAAALVKIATQTPAGKPSPANVAKLTAALKASSAKSANTAATPLPADASAAQMAAAAKIMSAGLNKAGPAAKPSSAAPAITKIEIAAMANASQEAVKTPAPQAKIEAQALPVNFDAAAKDAGDKNSGTQTGADGKDSKSGSDPTTGKIAQPAEAQAMKIADAPQTQSAPAHAAPAASTTNLNAAGTGVSAPAAPAHAAVTLQVAPQTQHGAADQPNLAALGVAIAAKSKDGEKQFDISMHPADLGRVDVRLSVDSDGKAQAHLVAEKPQTLQLLQNDKATLERSLKDAGLDLSNNGLNFSLKGEQQPSTPTFTARSRALSVAAVIDTASTTSHASIAPGDSRLDIRV